MICIYIYILLVISLKGQQSFVRVSSGWFTNQRSSACISKGKILGFEGMASSTQDHISQDAGEIFGPGSSWWTCLGVKYTCIYIFTYRYMTCHRAKRMNFGLVWEASVWSKIFVCRNRLKVWHVFFHIGVWWMDLTCSFLLSPCCFVVFFADLGRGHHPKRLA